MDFPQSLKNRFKNNNMSFEYHHIDSGNAVIRWENFISFLHNQ
jgi:hypothetical protein